jgi:hypothetical protein
VPAVDEVEEGVGGGRLVVALLHLAEANIVDDEQLGAGPRLEPSGVGGVGEAGVEVIEEIDATGVAEGDALRAGAQAEGLEDEALAGAALASDDQIVVAADEGEASELGDGGLVEVGLEVPVESFEGLLLAQAAGGDAACDAAFELGGDLGGEEVLEQRRVPGLLAGGPGEQVVEVAVDVGRLRFASSRRSSRCWRGVMSSRPSVAR